MYRDCEAGARELAYTKSLVYNISEVCAFIGIAIAVTAVQLHFRVVRSTWTRRVYIIETDQRVSQ
jgi:hypothetical protein